MGHGSLAFLSDLMLSRCRIGSLQVAKIYWYQVPCMVPGTTAVRIYICSTYCTCEYRSVCFGRLWELKPSYDIHEHAYQVHYCCSAVPGTAVNTSTPCCCCSLLWSVLAKQYLRRFRVLAASPEYQVPGIYCGYCEYSEYFTRMLQDFRVRYSGYSEHY